MNTVLLPLISGILLFLSFPEPELWFLAWIALVPLLVALTRLPRKQAFAAGMIAGLSYFMGCLYWLTHTMMVYGNLPLPVSFLLMLLLVIYLSAYVGLFTLGYKTVSQAGSPWQELLAAPCLWVLLEWLRAHLLTGFPWALLGHSQYRILPVIQIADLTGVYGVSFAIVMVNAALAQAMRSAPTVSRMLPALRTGWLPVGAAGLLVAGLLMYGANRLSQLAAQNDAQTIRVGIAQGNIRQDQKWDPAFQRMTMDTYRALTVGLQAMAASSRPTSQRTPDPNRRDGLDLVVWPETAAPFFFERDPKWRTELEALARESRTSLLFGSLAVGPRPDGPASADAARMPALYNSAYLLSETGRLAGRYDKIHLVPFGEYVPLSSLLFFVHRMVEGIGDFGAGRTHRVMEIPAGRFGVVICFEVIFPDLVRKFVGNGARFMATITNDAWFGRTSAPYQHFSMVVFRAVENRTPFVRAANTGISGHIDRTGRIRAATGLFEQASLVQEIAPGQAITFYTRYGDIFSYLCVIILMVILVPRYFGKAHR